MEDPPLVCGPEMALDDSLRADQQAQWYYAECGPHQGPVSGDQLHHMLASGKISPSTIVWREGMEYWTIIELVPGLIHGLSHLRNRNPLVRRQAQIEQVAWRNCTAMLVTLVFWMALFVIEVTAILIGERLDWLRGFHVLGIAAGLYVAVYLPIRWPVIRQLPGSFRLMGIIGGTGLIVFTVLTIARIVIAVVFDIHF